MPEGDRDPDRPTCATCGAPIDPHEWHPVATDRAAEAFTVVAFCDADCRAAWAEG